MASGWCDWAEARASVMETDLKSSPGSLWAQVHVHGQKLGQDQGQAHTKPPSPAAVFQSRGP